MSHHDRFSFPFSSISDDDFANQFQANVKSHNFVLPDASLLNSLFSNFLPDNPECTSDDDEETTLFPSNETKCIASDSAFSFQPFEFNNHNFTALSLNIRSINNYKNFAKIEAVLSSLNFSLPLSQYLKLGFDNLNLLTNLFSLVTRLSLMLDLDIEEEV